MGKASDGANINSGLSAKDEEKEVNQAKAKAGELKAGDIVYIISITWLRAWQSYCENEEDKPEQIDNSGILDLPNNLAKPSTGAEIEEFYIQLAPSLMDGEDFAILSEAEWLLLSKWYVAYFSKLYVVGYRFRGVSTRTSANGAGNDGNKFCAALVSTLFFLLGPHFCFLRSLHLISNKPLTHFLGTSEQVWWRSGY